MGLFDWFKKKRDYDEDDEEYEDENEGKDPFTLLLLELIARDLPTLHPLVLESLDGI